MWFIYYYYASIIYKNTVVQPLDQNSPIVLWNNRKTKVLSPNPVWGDNQEANELTPSPFFKYVFVGGMSDIVEASMFCTASCSLCWTSLACTGDCMSVHITTFVSVKGGLGAILGELTLFTGLVINISVTAQHVANFFVTLTSVLGGQNNDTTFTIKQTTRLGVTSDQTTWSWRVLFTFVFNLVRLTLGVFPRLDCDRITTFVREGWECWRLSHKSSILSLGMSTDKGEDGKEGNNHKLLHYWLVLTWIER